MCGIYCLISFIERNELKMSSHVASLPSEGVKKLLVRRGPNNSNEILQEYSDFFELHFFGTVLHLRGYTLSKQPVRNEDGSIFLWNGEIFDRFLMDSPSETDTHILAQKLFAVEDAKDILRIISLISGPFAFVLYQPSGFLWFGRDIFGRRSLLWNVSDFDFQLSSVSSENGKWYEVPASGIFCLDLNLSKRQKSFVIYEYLWSLSPSGNVLNKRSFYMHDAFSNVIQLVPDIVIQSPIPNLLNKTLLSESFSTILFSLLEGLQSNKHSFQEILKQIFCISDFKNTVQDFENVLCDAVKKRAKNQINMCKLCYSEKPASDSVTCDHASVGVLFSGGLDSIVLACLLNRHLSENKPIDLINVAFANSLAIEKLDEKEKHKAFHTPDRITGSNGLKELRMLHPHRKWNFVEVNISDTELITKRKESISAVLKPSCTVLDDSIGCALWFASQGDGLVSLNNEHTAYTSPVRVLLVGMGADEQLAGYSRHRAKFNSGGWEALIDEISIEIDRISSRNLARDDRVIADNGVESRYPFLDENVVSFLNSVPIFLKANLHFPRGIGEKLLLRLLALKLGLMDAAVLPKRAIQFGSRIAKMENSKEKGSDLCDRLT